MVFLLAASGNYSARYQLMSDQTESFEKLGHCEGLLDLSGFQRRGWRGFMRKQRTFLGASTLETQLAHCEVVILSCRPPYLLVSHLRA